ncbi:3-deoxy-7-phosphoheptulonate synthase [Rhodococcus hoagii]|uniref:Phospho-2-dehydro-3-deoxyheptonate aldolase n=1 Tax=Rhodococcus hoagii TaxID=43767 RepID=A0A9Q2SBS8_RHOHA|nr:3-deoxy-7-phosphoheptulonate synthase [Prescottella equi]
MTAIANDQRLDEQRTVSVSPLVAPSVVRAEHTPDEVAAATVRSGRADTVNILNGDDDRLVVVVGPCSVHDPEAAMDYARRLAAKAEELRDDLQIVMRVYFEKPRTTLGWKGLLNDPHLDGTFDINTGLRMGRKLLLDISRLGLPVGCEFLDPIIPQYIADLVTYGAIGARTAASQVHRQLCSALSMPVGIKNSTEGDVQVAVDGTRAAAASHVFPGTDLEGQAALIHTVGNPDCHVILRGGTDGPNYDAETVADTLARLAKSGLPERVVIDASHGNSRKDHHKAGRRRRRRRRADRGRREGDRGHHARELHRGGPPGPDAGRSDELTYGQSITDACIDWDTTASTLDRLAAAVATRRG